MKACERTSRPADVDSHSSPWGMTLYCSPVAPRRLAVTRLHATDVVRKLPCYLPITHCRWHAGRPRGIRPVYRRQSCVDGTITLVETNSWSYGIASSGLSLDSSCPSSCSDANDFYYKLNVEVWATVDRYSLLYLFYYFAWPCWGSLRINFLYTMHVLQCIQNQRLCHAHIRKRFRDETSISNTRALARKFERSEDSFRKILKVSYAQCTQARLLLWPVLITHASVKLLLVPTYQQKT